MLNLVNGVYGFSSPPGQKARHVVFLHQARLQLWRMGHSLEHMHTQVTLSKPVGVKRHPGPSLPKLMPQFNLEQTG